jgi:hypothetical protein
MANQCIAGLDVRGPSGVQPEWRERKTLGLIAKRVDGLSPERASGADYLPAPMDADPTRQDPYAWLRIPNFRRFILSLLTMNVATQLQAVVVSWQV